MIKLKNLLTETPDKLIIGTTLLRWYESCGTHVFTIYKNNWYLFDVGDGKFMAEDPKIEELIQLNEKHKTRRYMDLIHNMQDEPRHENLRMLMAYITNVNHINITRPTVKMEEGILEGRVFQHNGTCYMTFWGKQDRVKQFQNKIKDIIDKINIPLDRVKFEGTDKNNDIVMYSFEEYFNIQMPPELSKKFDDAKRMAHTAFSGSLNGAWKAALRNLKEGRIKLKRLLKEYDETEVIFGVLYPDGRIEHLAGGEEDKHPSSWHGTGNITWRFISELGYLFFWDDCNQQQIDTIKNYITNKLHHSIYKVQTPRTVASSVKRKYDGD